MFAPHNSNSAHRSVPAPALPQSSSSHMFQTGVLKRKSKQVMGGVTYTRAAMPEGACSRSKPHLQRMKVQHNTDSGASQKAFSTSDASEDDVAMQAVVLPKSPQKQLGVHLIGLGAVAVAYYFYLNYTR
jgi:hypothetical protein